MDIDARVVEALSARALACRGRAGRVACRRSARALRVTTRYADLAKVDAIIIAVPTPLTRNREPDLQPLIAAGTALAGVLQQGQLVVLESTTYPGTTRDQFVPLLEESGLAAGRDFHVAFSPERIDPGRTDFTLRNTPKVVGGLTRRVPRAAPSRSTSEVCDEIVRGLDARGGRADQAARERLPLGEHRARQRAGDPLRPDGHRHLGGHRRRRHQAVRLHAFKPGPGMGGHCLPVDPFYLAWRAREFDMQTEFIELAGEVNQRMPYFCVERDRAGAQRPREGRARLARRRSSASPTSPASATCASRPALRSSGCCASRAPSSSTTTTSCPSCPSIGLRSEWPEDVRLRGDRHRASGARRGARRARGAARRRLPRRDARDRGPEPRASVTTVGVVGLGYWGPNLARNFDRLPDAELTWLCDASEEALARWGAGVPVGAHDRRARRPAERRRARRGRDRHAGADARRPRHARARGREALLRGEAAGAQSEEEAEARGRGRAGGGPGAHGRPPARVPPGRRAAGRARRRPASSATSATSTRTASTWASSARTRTRSGRWARTTSR